MAMKKTDYVGVYQDSETGKIQVQISLGTDPVTGKRVRLKSMKNENNKPFKSIAEANKYVVINKAKYFKTGSFSISNVTFEEFVNDEYLPYYESTVRPQTYKSKLIGINVIRDYFGKTKLKSMDVSKVHKFRQWLVKKGYKPSYSSNLFSTFKRILDYAEVLGYIQSNPSHKVKALPKGRATVAFWSRKEIEKVLSVICLDDPYEHLCYVMLIVYFMTGMRVNEATALYWEDIDWARKQVHVRHNLVLKTKRDYIRSTDMKTKNAQRFVSLDDSTLQILKEWKTVQTSLGLGRKKDFILSHDGYPMIKSTISRIIKRYAGLAGVHDIQAKGLRHSHVSFLVNEFNTDILLISRRLGHSSPEITYRHYAHLYSGADRDIADAIDGKVNFKSLIRSEHDN